MAASRVINQQSFHDGKLVLYQLENCPKQLWLCRIKVPNGTGYVYRGTGNFRLLRGEEVRRRPLDELRIKTKLGQSVTGPNLARMAEEFETHSRAKGEPTNWWNYHLITYLIGGGEGIKVQTEEELESAVAIAIKSNKVFIINCVVDSNDTALKRMEYALAKKAR